MSDKLKLFMIDNFDSFTYNLVDEFQQLGLCPVIYRNTLEADFIFNKMKEATAEGFQALLVLSPGPGNPQQAGCLMSLIALVAGEFPILGICLGHQALVEHYGGQIDRAPYIVHGKSSLINHDGTGPFAGLASPLAAARYHSLVATRIPQEVKLLANYQELPMAIGHQHHAILGFQFHPESLLTTSGSQLLKNSLDYLISMSRENS
jgi:anthranilate synthase component 2